MSPAAGKGPLTFLRRMARFSMTPHSLICNRPQVTGSAGRSEDMQTKITDGVINGHSVHFAVEVPRPNRPDPRSHVPLLDRFSHRLYP